MSKPSRARRSAIARPMPRLEPVMSTVPVMARCFRTDGVYVRGASCAQLCQRVEARFGLRDEGVAVVPGVAGQHRADDLFQVLRLPLAKHDLLEGAVVPR